MRYLPDITKRVVFAILVLVAGVATNVWHKNIASGLVIVITAVALAVWLGTELGKKQP